MHAERATAASCAFSMAGEPSGDWLESPEGDFARVGQAISLDGQPGGEYVVAARLDSDGNAPCVEPVGRDTMGHISDGTELANTCVVETLLSSYNSMAADWGWTPMWNFTTREVCSRDRPELHPDQADLVRSYAQPGSEVDDTFCYTGYGACLNDINGAERDWLGDYWVGDGFCHYIVSGGLEAPAAKRPATRSLPAPGLVNDRSYVLWRPVNPNLAICN
jgi:hypothetical protein